MSTLPQFHAHRVARIAGDHKENPEEVERALQPLYMVADPIVDLSEIEAIDAVLTSRLKHLNRYHTSRGGNRIRLVVNHPTVRHGLGESTANVFRLYDTLEEALTTIK